MGVDGGVGGGVGKDGGFGEGDGVGEDPPEVGGELGLGVLPGGGGLVGLGAGVAWPTAPFVFAEAALLCLLSPLPKMADTLKWYVVPEPKPFTVKDLPLVSPAKEKPFDDEAEA